MTRRALVFERTVSPDIRIREHLVFVVACRALIRGISGAETNHVAVDTVDQSVRSVQRKTVHRVGHGHSWRPAQVRVASTAFRPKRHVVDDRGIGYLLVAGMTRNTFGRGLAWSKSVGVTVCARSHLVSTPQRKTLARMTIFGGRPGENGVTRHAPVAKCTVPANATVTKRFVLGVTADAFIGCVSGTVAARMTCRTSDAGVTTHKRETVLWMPIVRRFPGHNRVTGLTSVGEAPMVGHVLVPTRLVVGVTSNALIWRVVGAVAGCVASRALDIAVTTRKWESINRMADTATFGRFPHARVVTALARRWIDIDVHGVDGCIVIILVTGNAGGSTRTYPRVVKVSLAAEKQSHGGPGEHPDPRLHEH